MMHSTLLLLKTDLKSYMENLYNDYKDGMQLCSDSIIYEASLKLSKYKKEFESIDFPTKRDEIFYFKHIKTKTLAIVHLFQYIKSIEGKKPAVKFEKLKKYYLKKLVKAKTEIQELDYYYSYFITKANHSDEKFFTRMETDMVRNVSNVVIEVDCRSSTPYIFLFSKAEALFHLKQFLKSKINKFNNQNIEITYSKNKLKWTASKSDLTELIYALYASGVLNNGKATIKEIVDTMQDTFQIDIGNHTRTFYDIKLRKKLKTKHMDHLKDSLLNKINSIDFDTVTE